MVELLLSFWRERLLSEWRRRERRELGDGGDWGDGRALERRGGMKLLTIEVGEEFVFCFFFF